MIGGPGKSALCLKQTHAPRHDRRKKERPPRGGLSETQSVFCQFAIAASFRFLRQPSRPIVARPDANNGKAAGSGVAVGVSVSTVLKDPPLNPQGPRQV